MKLKNTSESRRKTDEEDVPDGERRVRLWDELRYLNDRTDEEGGMHVRERTGQLEGGDREDERKEMELTSRASEV